MTSRVVGIGELLWDRFPDGDRLGGAPANFAFHAGQLGASASIVSRIGTDDDGARLAATLEDRQISTRFIQRDAALATGIVRVELHEGQPAYVIEKPAAWDAIEFTDDLENLAAEADAVCFGTLAQREPASRAAIQKFVSRSRPDALRLFDINLRQHFHDRGVIEFGLKNATALKLNSDELAHLIASFGWPRQADEAIARLFQLYPLQWIAVTHGAEGCTLHSRETRVKAEAVRVTCVDAVGAGDAFSAALVMGLLAQRPLEEIAAHANAVGAFVASHAGAMPALPNEYKSR